MKMMNRNKQRGFNLLEVVVGIAVFAIGMLALAAFQGSLTRSMAEAKVRTQASNLANDTIERFRGFTTLPTTAGELAYEDIVDTTTTVTINGVVYTVAVDATDYYYQLATDSFTTTSNGNLHSNYKQVEVVVGWDAVQNLRTVEGTEIASTVFMPDDVTIGVDGDGNDIQVTGIKLTSLIPALVTSASARVSDEEGSSELPTPQITYTPGLNPDVIALSLGDSKFKESLLPQPEVIRTDKIETTFDVITYSSDGSNALFLRREVFTAVSCDCDLNAADADNPGRRPVIWAGDEYTGGEFVAKPYGTSATNQQSDLCDTCCRDHHDGGTGTNDSADTYSNVYGPFKGDAEYTGTARESDHKHYQSDGITIAGTGDQYEEVCRMVRVNGFFRVAQDFRREDQYIFPDDFLDEDAEIDDYSTYVTEAVGGSADSYFSSTKMVDGYPADPPCIGLNGDGDNDPTTLCDAEPTMQGDPQTAIATGELPSWSQLRTTNRETQQLRSRGIYIDYISNDLRSFLSTCISGGELVENCTVGDVALDQTGSTNLLEILPFFDVQMTFLNNWAETPAATVVDVTSEALDDFNAHSRGMATQVSQGSADIEAKGHRGNVGFTDTQAIDPLHNSHITEANLLLCSLDAAGNGTCGTAPPPSGNAVINGTFTIDPGVTPTPTIDVAAVGDAIYVTHSGASWTMEVPNPSTGAGMRVFGYGKNNKTRWACLTPFVASVVSVFDPNGAGAYTIFNLNLLDPATTYNINIQESACPSS